MKSKISKILKPKTPKEIFEVLSNILIETDNLIEFVKKYDIQTHKRTLKAYHYIAEKLMSNYADEVYILYSDHPFYKMVHRVFYDIQFNMHPVKNVTLMIGPFSHALVKRGDDFSLTQLLGLSPAFLIGIDHVFDIINLNTN